MMKIEVETKIAAKPEVVFRAASNFENAATMIEGIEKIEMLTEGPAQVGTRFKETRIMFGKEATEEMEVIQFDAPHSYTLCSTSHGVRYESTFRFEEAAEGTAVTMVFGGQPLTFLAKVMSFMMKPMIKSVQKICQKDLEDLKTHLESKNT